MDSGYGDDFEAEAESESASQLPEQQQGQSASRESTSAAVDAVQQAILSGFWRREVDKTTNKPYYYHVVTRKTTWDLAGELQASGAQSSPPEGRATQESAAMKEKVPTERDGQAMGGGEDQSKADEGSSEFSTASEVARRAKLEVEERIKAETPPVEAHLSEALRQEKPHGIDQRTAFHFGSLGAPVGLTPAKPDAPVVVTDGTSAIYGKPLQHSTASAEALAHIMPKVTRAPAQFPKPSEPSFGHPLDEATLPPWVREMHHSSLRKSGTVEHTDPTMPRWYQNESKLHEELLDLALAMALQRRVVVASGQRKSRSQLPTAADRRRMFREYLKEEESAGNKKTAAASRHEGMLLDAPATLFQELSAFALRGALQAVIMANFQKYIVTPLKAARFHSCVLRFILIDATNAIYDMVNYATIFASSDNDATSSCDPFYTSMMFLSLKPECKSRRVCELVSRTLHCMPFESVLGSRHLDNTPAETNNSALYRLDYWVTRSHVSEMLRALGECLRVVEESTVDATHMAIPSRGLTPLNENDEEDVISCLSPLLSFWALPRSDQQGPRGRPARDIGKAPPESGQTSTKATLTEAPSALLTVTDNLAKEVVFRSAANLDPQPMASYDACHYAVVTTLMEMMSDPAIRESVLRRASAHLVGGTALETAKASEVAQPQISTSRE